MNDTGLMAFFSMGGYALYVWGSLGMCAAVMALEVWQLRQRHRQLLQQTPLTAQTPASHP
jgi:heme exporter protein D